MSLTIPYCEDMIRQTLNQELAPELSVPEMVNETGRWLYSQAWSWTSRQGTLGVTAAQNYVSVSSLPAIKIEAVRYTNTIAYWLEPTTIDEIVLRRVSTLVNGAPALWAAHWRDDANLIPYRTLEFDTEFAATDATGLTVVYSKAWVMNGGFVPIPTEYEGLFTHALMAVARGYMEKDIASIAVRLAEIKLSNVFTDLVAMDQAFQLRRGAMRGGGVNGQLMGLPTPNYQRIHL